MRLSLCSPARLKRHGRILGADRLQTSDLLLALSSRLGLLARHYGGHPEQFRWSRFIDAATTDTTEDLDLSWLDWTRYSSRQHTRMQLSGHVGSLTLTGARLDKLWPLPWYG